MNEILVSMVRGLLDYSLPIIVPAVTSWLAFKFNGFINLKQQELKVSIQSQEINKLTEELLSKVKINDAILEIVNKKALEGLKLAEEKAFQSWKDNNKRELTGQEKQNIAVEYVNKSINGLTEDKNILSLIPKIVEQNLSVARNELDKVFVNLKQNFVMSNGGIIPENSRNPFIQGNPNIVNVTPDNNQ